MSHASRHDPDLDRTWYDDDQPETWTCSSCGDEVESNQVAVWDPIICHLCVEISEDAVEELTLDEGPWTLDEED